jgi:hypothetical protein
VLDQRPPKLSQQSVEAGACAKSRTRNDGSLHVQLLSGAPVAQITHMRRIAPVGGFLLLAQAQPHPTIEVGENRLLSTSGPARPLAELQLAKYCRRGKGTSFEQPVSVS